MQPLIDQTGNVLPAKYFEGTSELVVEVRPDKHVFDFDLKSQ
jgi:hypothetical protein